MLLLFYIKLIYFLNGIYLGVSKAFFFALERPSCWSEFLKIFLFSKTEKA